LCICMQTCYMRYMHRIYPSHTHNSTSHHSLSLHHALPILDQVMWPLRSSPSTTCAPHGAVDPRGRLCVYVPVPELVQSRPKPALDRKSTRLNCNHVKISYGVFCMKNIKIEKNE